ncbi:exported hypothetical protein [Candidatus Zixiibacteriota bacterium]|nr:exported hypothetical protein [candidate division Zixibacteria bacterium]
MKSKIIAIMTVLFVLSVPSAFSLGGLKLMTVEPGARPSGMGGAFTAVSMDPYSVAYNPAAGYGAGPLRGAVGHNAYWENIRLETGYISFDKDEVCYSVGTQFAVVGDIQGRGNTPTSEYYPFDLHDFSFKFGAAFKASDNIIVGGMVGWFFEKIETYSGSALNADLGILMTATPKLTLGASALNLGGKMKLRDEDYSLPSTYRMGASYQLKNFLPVADIVIQDSEFHLHLGGEYEIKGNFLIRSGYRFGYDSKDFSAGVGFVQRNFRVDYAFVPYKNNLGDSHLINLTFHL